MSNIVKTKTFGKFLGVLIRIGIGIMAAIFLFLTHNASTNTEIYQKYTKKVLVELDKHELLKHQIAQGSIVFESDKNKGRKAKQPVVEKKEEKNPDQEKIITNVYNNKEEIKLNNAVISNNSYTIVTEIDFRGSKHPFAQNQYFCTFSKHLSPELKDNIFTKIYFGDLLIRKDSKKSQIEDEDPKIGTIDKDCKNQPTIIKIETKFYPKDLQTSPYQIQDKISNLDSFLHLG